MAYTDTSAFCLQTDVEGLVQRGVFTANTKPTAQQVLDWMARYAGEIESTIAAVGSSYTVSARNNPFPGSPSPAVARLKMLCESANALGAASQVVAMHSVLGGSGSTDAATEMFERYTKLLEELVVAASNSVASAALVSRTDTTDLAFLTNTEF